MEALKAVIEQLGLQNAVRVWAPHKLELLNRNLEERGYSPKLPVWDDTNAGDFECSRSYLGDYFTGPLGDGTYLRIWFTRNEWDTHQASAGWSFVNYDARQCRYDLTGCTCEYDEDDNLIEDCNYCEYGEEYCTYHNTGH